jgi:hypothetical protein
MNDTKTRTAVVGPLDQAVGQPMPKREVFAWECNVRGKDWHRTINHLTAGKARYEYLLDLRDSWPDATFADITVRKIGPAHTSEAFKRIAAYRGMPDLKCGQRVQVLMPSDKPVLGFILSHNDSANFDVLFDKDTIFNGGIGNVHPSELLMLPNSI